MHHIQLIQIKRIKMRIMQLYRIESDYQNHKKRLQSIQKENPKRKIDRITSQHFYLTKQHLKIKQVDHTFHQREQSERREHVRSLMNRTITQHSKKIKQQYEPLNTILPPTQRTNRSASKGGEIDKIEMQNAKMKFKIDNMKSIYRNFRRNSETVLNIQKSEKELNRKTEKEKLAELLKKQFNLQPIVTFPKTKNKTSHQELQIEGIDEIAFKKDVVGSFAEDERVLQ